MALISSVSSFFARQTPAALEMRSPAKVAPSELAGLETVQAPKAAPSFGAIFDNLVSEVDGKMKAGAAEQAKVLTGESTNLHQAMISMQEGSVAFSLMVEVRNKLIESYQELMRMQV